MRPVRVGLGAQLGNQPRHMFVPLGRKVNDRGGAGARPLEWIEETRQLGRRITRSTEADAEGCGA